MYLLAYSWTMLAVLSLEPSFTTMISHEKGDELLLDLWLFSRPMRYLMVGSKHARSRCSSLYAGKTKDMHLLGESWMVGKELVLLELESWNVYGLMRGNGSSRSMKYGDKNQASSLRMM